MYPYMPTITDSLLMQLNAPMRSIPDHFGYDDLQVGHLLGTPEHLFKRMEEKDILKYRQMFSGKQDVVTLDAAKAKAKATAKGKRPASVDKGPLENGTVEKQLENVTLLDSQK